MWGLSLLFILFTVLLLDKGMELRALGTDVDGEGIGLNLMGIEVNERVQKEHIPAYAKSFLLMGIVMLSLTILTCWKLFNNLQKE